MSKSRGVGVFLSSPAPEMYGAIMAQPDEMIEVLFINNTRIPLSEKDSILSMGPRQAKAKIAREIVEKFYGEEKAQSAEEEFNKTFRDKKLPEQIPEFSGDNSSITNWIVEIKFAESNTESKRLIDQGAVRVNEVVIKDWGTILKSGDIVQVGPRKFAKVK